MTTRRKRLSAHFFMDEFECKCGCVMPEEVEDNVRLIAPRLELIRKAACVPLTVTSGYRCPDRNKSVGGSKHSHHLIGLACDVHSCMPGAFVAGIATGLMSANSMPDGGIGLYDAHPQMCHIDWRGHSTRWRKT